MPEMENVKNATAKSIINGLQAAERAAAPEKLPAVYKSNVVQNNSMRSKAAKMPPDLWGETEKNNFLGLFVAFCKKIKKDAYTVAPTMLEFCYYLEDRAGKSLNTPEIYKYTLLGLIYCKKELENLRADILIAGGMRAAYDKTLVIFTLKNWAGWTDKAETLQNTAPAAIQININTV